MKIGSLNISEPTRKYNLNVNVDGDLEYSIFGHTYLGWL